MDTVSLSGSRCRLVNNTTMDNKMDWEVAGLVLPA